jgi:hypothetical protein
MRGAEVYNHEGVFHHAILPDGTIAGLELTAGETLVVRDDDGIPYVPPSTWLSLRAPIPVRIEDRMTMSEGSTLQLQFDADEWDSRISFEPGMPVELGGALELSFAEDVDAATQVGRTLHVFNWTGVEPRGAFHVTSPYLWDLSNLYSTGEVRLTGTGAAADYDGSGTVDQADVDLVLLNWGAGATAPPAGWINDLPTGIIDQGELDGVLLNWGAGDAMVAASAAVPEPSGVLLVLIALATAISMRHRK